MNSLFVDINSIERGFNTFKEKRVVKTYQNENQYPFLTTFVQFEGSALTSEFIYCQIYRDFLGEIE